VVAMPVSDVNIFESLASNLGSNPGGNSLGVGGVERCVDQNGGVGTLDESESCGGEGEVVWGIKDSNCRIEIGCPG